MRHCIYRAHFTSSIFRDSSACNPIQAHARNAGARDDAPLYCFALDIYHAIRSNIEIFSFKLNA